MEHTNVGRTGVDVSQPERVSVAVLDDYQGVAASSADWDSLSCEVKFIHHHLGTASEVVGALEGFSVVVAMRERTGFDAGVLENLPDLQLLVTTGMRNASIDLAAADTNSVVVCGTRSPGHATAELAFALIQVLARGRPGPCR